MEKIKDEKWINSKRKFVLSISENGYGKKPLILIIVLLIVGKDIGIVNSPRNGNITSSFPVYEGDEILLNNKGRAVRVAVKEIRTVGRNTRGKNIKLLVKKRFRN